MSSARVCSPPMDRLNLPGSFGSGPRTFLSARRNAVCKNLFGTPDRNNSFVKDKISEIQNQSKRKWNFDFAREQPLEGRFIWTPVESSQSSNSSGRLTAGVPQAYDLKRMNIGSGVQIISTSSSTSSSSSSISRTGGENADANYFIPEPVVFPNEPLLIVREEQVPVTASAASSFTCASQSQSLVEEATARNSCDQRIQSDTEQSNTRNNPDTCLPSSPSSAASSSTCASPLTESESSPETSTESATNNTISIKSKARHQKQTHVSDFFKVNKVQKTAVKRTAELPPSIGGEKRAAL